MQSGWLLAGAHAAKPDRSREGVESADEGVEMKFEVVGGEKRDTLRVYVKVDGQGDLCLYHESDNENDEVLLWISQADGELVIEAQNWSNARLKTNANGDGRPVVRLIGPGYESTARW